MSELPCHPDLRKVLDACENSGHDPQCVCPVSEVVWMGDDENHADDNSNKTVKEADKGNRDRSSPCILVLDFVVW